MQLGSLELHHHAEVQHMPPLAPSLLPLITAPYSTHISKMRKETRMAVRKSTTAENIQGGFMLHPPISHSESTNNRSTHPQGLQESSFWRLNKSTAHYAKTQPAVAIIVSSYTPQRFLN